MKKLIILICVCAASCFFGGCVTEDLAYKEDVYMVRTQVNEKTVQIEDRLSAMEGRFDSVERSQEDIQQRLASLESTLSGKISSYEDETRKMQEELNSAKSSLASDFDKKMNVVIEEVVRENEKIAEKLNAMQKDKYDVGVYHTVNKGETLSQIASQYGISQEDIIKANELEQPDKLKVGQKLFIPQR